jgi:hypothetical protein
MYALELIILAVVSLVGLCLIGGVVRGTTKGFSPTGPLARMPNFVHQMMAYLTIGLFPLVGLSGIVVFSLLFNLTSGLFSFGYFMFPGDFISQTDLVMFAIFGLLASLSLWAFSSAAKAHCDSFFKLGDFRFSIRDGARSWHIHYAPSDPENTGIRSLLSEIKRDVSPLLASLSPRPERLVVSSHLIGNIQGSDDQILRLVRSAFKQSGFSNYELHDREPLNRLSQIAHTQFFPQLKSRRGRNKLTHTRTLTIS